MRVALINPRFRLPIDTRTTAHLGLAYLGAVSQKRGDTVRIFDADVEEQPVEDFIQEFKPHLIGITANTPQVKQAWRTAKAIKAVHDVPIVMGGPHPSVASEGLDYELVERPYVDMVVRGEGEGPWLEISDKVEDFLRQQRGHLHGRADGSGQASLGRCPGPHLQDQRRPGLSQHGRQADQRPGQPALAGL